MKYDIEPRENIKNRSFALDASERVYVFVLLAICLIIILFVMFVPTGIAPANNGDFYRLAIRVGIDGRYPESVSSYPFFSVFYENWPWLPFSWNMISPLYPQFSNIFPITFIRGLTNILFGDTAVNWFSIWYIGLTYSAMLLIALWLLFRFGVITLKRQGLWLICFGIVVLLGSVHLCWFSSFYGEAMLYVSLLLLLGCLSNAIIAPKGSAIGKTMALLALPCAFLFLNAKAQGVLSFPLWAILILVLIFRHWPISLKKIPVPKKLLTLLVILVSIVCLAFNAVSCYKLYTWNSDYNEKDTLYSAVFYGLLLLTDEPETLLEKLGLGRELAENVGYHAYSSERILIQQTPEAEERFYSKLNTYGLLKFYLKNPVYLYRAMQVTTDYAKSYDTNLFLTRNGTNDEGEPIFTKALRFSLWERIRPDLMPKYFWQYMIIYLTLFGFCFAAFFKAKNNAKTRLLISLFVVLMLTGIIQFPLPFIGNGLADTSKQLYLFKLMYDLTMLISFSWLWVASMKHLRALMARRKKKDQKSIEANDKASFE